LLLIKGGGLESCLLFVMDMP